MRLRFAALLCALGMIAAPSVGSAQSTARNWTYAYTDGAATATHNDDRGRMVATIVCRPPDGVMVLSDSTFGRSARNARTVAVRIGQMTINVPATNEGRRLVINLPQRPPVLAGVQRDDELSVTADGETHSYGPGSGKQMEDVAYACWQGGT